MTNYYSIFYQRFQKDRTALIAIMKYGMLKHLTAT